MTKPVIAIAGSSGLIGSALAAALRNADHPVLRIVRRTPANSDELHRRRQAAKPVDRRRTLDPRSQPRALPACRRLCVAPGSVGAQHRKG
jgi:nucleoside-diphosphate-sugar epimerase